MVSCSRRRRLTREMVSWPSAWKLPRLSFHLTSARAATGFDSAQLGSHAAPNMSSQVALPSTLSSGCSSYGSFPFKTSTFLYCSAFFTGRGGTSVCSGTRRPSLSKQSIETWRTLLLKLNKWIVCSLFIIMLNALNGSFSVHVSGLKR